jgi:hypothetical protein
MYVESEIRTPSMNYLFILNVKFLTTRLLVKKTKLTKKNCKINVEEID